MHSEGIGDPLLTPTLPLLYPYRCHQGMFHINLVVIEGQNITNKCQKA